MYLRILKKDLKRKKTMNIILLMFIILATLFVSSSVNNIMAVTNSLDHYFEKANMPDYFVATMDKGRTDSSSISDTLDSMNEIDNYGIEHILYLNPENLIYKGKSLDSMNNASVLLSYEDAEINYFDNENKVIEGVEPGKVLISGKYMKENNISVGDTIEIQLGDVSGVFEIAGGFKDAALGSHMMGMARFIINDKDFEKYKSDEMIASMYGGSLCYINTKDTRTVETVLNEKITNTVFLGSSEMLKMTYVMDVIIAGILLVVSACLILVAFFVLKFTITFTLMEEFREIGVMKAIGIGEVKIRTLYMTKYFMLAVVGAVVGFIGSIPFGNMMLQSVSQSIVMGTKHGNAINIICSIVVVLVILMFCFVCTGKLRKFTPMDAIRSGTTGERFQKKGKLRLGSSHLKPSSYLAANDVLSSPKRYATVILTFTLCLSLVLILVNSINTLRSDDLILSFGLSPSDIFYSDEGKQMSFMVKDGRKLLEDELDEMERTLKKNGMPAKCFNDVIMKLTLVHDDNISKSQVLQGIRTTADQYVYFEGTPPQNEQEIAITNLTAKKLGASIGDTIIMNQIEGAKEYIITAMFQSMNNMGEGVRLHESVEADFIQTAGYFPIQITFTDDPDQEEIHKRIEKIKKLYDNEKVYTAGEYIENMVGVADTLESVRVLVLMVIITIIILVTVLMERSFTTKERGEIAILKAIGFSDGAIIRWHTLRFGIVAVISVIISLLLIIPLTEISVGPIFRMMGADYGVTYEFVPLEVFVIYPLLVLIITMLSAYVTALYTKSISASETSNIE